MRITNRLNIVDFEKVKAVASVQITKNANISKCPLIRENIRWYKIWGTMTAWHTRRVGLPPSLAVYYPLFCLIHHQNRIARVPRSNVVRWGRHSPPTSPMHHPSRALLGEAIETITHPLHRKSVYLERRGIVVRFDGVQELAYGHAPEPEGRIGDRILNFCISLNICVIENMRTCAHCEGVKQSSWLENEPPSGIIRKNRSNGFVPCEIGDCEQNGQRNGCASSQDCRGLFKVLGLNIMEETLSNVTAVLCCAPFSIQPFHLKLVSSSTSSHETNFIQNFNNSECFIMLPRLYPQPKCLCRKRGVDRLSYRWWMTKLTLLQDG